MSESSRPDPNEAVPTNESVVAQLREAKDRLAFYESFDAMIQANVRQSGELLRSVAAERERVEARLASMRQELDDQIAAQQAMLRGLAASLDGVQQNLSGIAGQVAAALSQPAPVATEPQLSAMEPPADDTVAVWSLADGGDAARSSLSLAARDAALPALAAGHDAASVSLHAGVAELSLADSLATGADVAAADPDEVESADADHAASAEPLKTASAAFAATQGPPTDEGESPGPEGAAVAEPSDVTEHEPPSVQRFDLIVRGVPRAAVAHTIQRHVQDLPEVQAVEVREFIAGVLRFQVDASALDPTTLAAWPESTAQVVSASERAVELEYATTGAARP